MANFNELSDITTLATGDKLAVNDASDSNTTKSTTPGQILTYVQTNAALAGERITSGTVADVRIASTITRDSDLATVATSGDYGDLSNTPTIPTVPVDSVYGRTGAVVAAASDYDASQIDNGSAVSGAFVDDALNTLDTAKIESYSAAISSSTGSTILQATHDLASSRSLTIAFYDGDGDAIGIVKSVAANGDVTWASNDSLSGTIVITG